MYFLSSYPTILALYIYNHIYTSFLKLFYLARTHQYVSNKKKGKKNRKKSKINEEIYKCMRIKPHNIIM